MRREKKQPSKEPDQAIRKPLGLVPEISREDLVEQLLLEYQSAPNPGMMQYAYEVTRTDWQCPCGSRNLLARPFCGRCGVSRAWLQEHTSKTYLAERIAERKGQASVRWHTGETGRVPVISEDLLSVLKEDREEPEKLRIPTRLAGYEGNFLTKKLKYMSQFGTPARQLILGLVGLSVLILLAILVSKH